MNKNALTRQSTYKVGKTNTGKLPDSFGFGGAIQGVTRRLTKREQDVQRKIMNHEK